jgi:hypothetical protein
MKPLFQRLAGRRAFDFGMPVAATLLLSLTALAVRAATPYTSTGWVIGAPLPGIWCTNAQDQAMMRANAHLVRVNSTDPRLTGRRLVFVDGAAQADGSVLLSGTEYQEVGTWDATGTNFTPSGGMWQATFSGLMQSDYSLQLSIAGYGCGGTIDGLRIEETMTRDWASGLMDPALPYNYTGTIKPPPSSTNLVLDNFSGPAVGWTYYGPQSYSYTRPDGQLLVTGHWPGVITRSVPDTYTFGAPPVVWTVADGETLESRVDLVNLKESATAARLVLGTESGFYSFFKGHGFMAVIKWSANLAWGPVIMFFYREVQTPDTNVILTLALTRANPDVVITARVLDKTNPNSVFYECSVVDTPNADPALTSAELLSLSDMSLATCPDVPGAPFTTAGAPIGVWQYNYDGLRPPAVATFDNLELRKYQIPQLGITRAVRLSWPAPAGVNWSVRAAPTVQGPWLPVQELELPGIQTLTVPLGNGTRFFRLWEAP